MFYLGINFGMLTGNGKSHLTRSMMFTFIQTLIYVFLNFFKLYHTLISCNYGTYRNTELTRHHTVSGSFAVIVVCIFELHLICSYFKNDKTQKYILPHFSPERKQTNKNTFENIVFKF